MKCILQTIEPFLPLKDVTVFRGKVILQGPVSHSSSQLELAGEPGQCVHKNRFKVRYLSIPIHILQWINAICNSGGFTMCNLLIYPISSLRRHGILLLGNSPHSVISDCTKGGMDSVFLNTNSHNKALWSRRGEFCAAGSYSFPVVFTENNART